MRVLAAALMAAMLVGPALGADEGACFVASGIVHADFALPHVAAAIGAKHLNVAVVGSASSTLPGTEGAAKAYPARLEESLKRRLPTVTVKVTAHTRARETAAEMAKSLQAAKSDAMFMNMQYSPRTDSMIALGSYVEAMRFVALQREIPLFDRLAVMKNWNEMGVFDFYSTTKRIEFAERVHDCIGRLLARLVVDSADLAAQANNSGAGSSDVPKKDIH